ncbi:MAG: undecaprenyl/decaprenyl-phosphate alpha-N-acetylglucosaminyl 1-phosphate transferase, partial [Myxococcales bacterium]|nr:undecaprenyl/decaprenyl-phosphate alpha-N-acetylglucosaminyl 1-phosphate transferase [Myxococcales bacterium]
MMTYAFSFLTAFACSLLATFAVRWLARARGLVAKPRADRWHQKPTALFGGVGIFAAFVASVLLGKPANVSGDAILLVCTGGMFALGLVDDFVQLKPYAKLVGQIICATAFTMYGLRLHWLPIPVLDQALTILWLVGITNAVNLLDNIDGLAGGVAAIAGAYLVYFCHASGDVGAATLAAGFVGAVAGFLVFNFNPASIFMGDCGSLFLGFFLGGMALVGPGHGASGSGQNFVVLSVPVLILLIPIIDTALVTVSRHLNQRPISQGGRDHTSHRLVALGLSERAATLTLWFLAAVSGAIAVLVRNVSWALGALVVPAFALVIVLFVVFVGRVRVYQQVDSAAEARGRAILPTVADFSYKRRVFEVLADLLVITLAYFGAFMFRWDGELIEPFYRNFTRSLPLVI